MIRLLLVDDQQLVRAGFRVILDTEPDFEVVGEARDGVEAVALAAQLKPDVICMDVEMPNMNGIEAARQILAHAAEAAQATQAAAADGAVANGGVTGAREPAILILTTFGHEAYLFDALAAGVSGFLLKTSRAEQLIDAVRMLASGQALLGPDVTRAVIERVAAERAAGAADRPSGHDTSVNASANTDEGTDESRGEDTGEGTHTVTSANTARSANTGAGATGVTSAGRDPARCAMDAAGLTERERDVIQLLAEGRSNSEIAGLLFLGETTVKTHVSNILQKLGARDRIQAVVWAHTNNVLTR